MDQHRSRTWFAHPWSKCLHLQSHSCDWCNWPGVGHVVRQHSNLHRHFDPELQHPPVDELAVSHCQSLSVTAQLLLASSSTPPSWSKANWSLFSLPPIPILPTCEQLASLPAIFRAVRNFHTDCARKIQQSTTSSRSATLSPVLVDQFLVLGGLPLWGPFSSLFPQDCSVPSGWYFSSPQIIWLCQASGMFFHTSCSKVVWLPFLWSLSD